MVLRRYTQNDVIFPTALFLRLSLPPAVPRHYFSLFLSPQCNLIRLDCPLATSPNGHVALYPLPNPLPLPLPLYLFLRSGNGLIDVQQPYITVQPSLSGWWLQSCHTARSIRVTPAVHTDHCLRNWKHISKLQNGPCLKKHGLDNASNYSSVITEIN